MNYNYEAGFFDGEGSITIQRVGPKREQFTLQVALASNSKKMIDVYAHWGGRLATYEAGIRQHGKSGIRNCAKSYALFFNREEAEGLLKDLLPYLRLKREQADIALQFIEAYKKLSPLRIKGKVRGRPHYLGQELETYQSLYETMKKLNAPETS